MFTSLRVSCCYAHDRGRRFLAVSRATMASSTGLLHSVTPPSVPTKQEKCYDPHDPTLKFVDKEDDLDFLCEGFKSLRAQMSCGHVVTPTSLTNWCRRLLDQFLMCLLGKMTAYLDFSWI
ncbi:uncharacterized protein LOC134618662 isoform X2 [Pelmatolapia mariae]|uniref:uncharacterized protein LOC134618662 isoform X2 n=1 Tax=Pelmatolapia mariae TaxID=158779 RepID=UPI002FE51328